jgi:L-lysine exporter family protein LysE/ArgO
MLRAMLNSPVMSSLNLPLLSAWAAGFVLCLSLIVAIGAQNLFLLRQGLQRQHVGACVAWCAGADTVLAALGVAGTAQALVIAPWLAQALAWAGAAFLLAYGLMSLRRAWRGGDAAATTEPGGTDSKTLALVLAQMAALTLLNPHVYLDTLVLIGSVGARQPGGMKWVFVAGVACASLCWFVAVGYGARLLQPLFAKPRAWRVLDLLTGCAMLALAGWLGGSTFASVA